MTELKSRTGLPDALRVLLADFPRQDWTGHRNFDGLVSFWLDRHMMFRRMTTLLTEDANAFLDRQSDAQGFAARLGQVGGQFVSNLYGHHQIEDAHYFPKLATMDPRLAAGFELLDHDHHALDRHIAEFVASANTVLRQWQDREAVQTAAGGFAADLGRIARLLDRHLIDEEELVVPVILKFGAGHLE